MTGGIRRFFEIAHFVRSVLLGSYKTGETNLKIIEKSTCNLGKIGYNARQVGRKTGLRGQRTEDIKEVKNGR